MKKLINEDRMKRKRDALQMAKRSKAYHIFDQPNACQRIRGAQGEVAAGGIKLNTIDIGRMRRDRKKLVKLDCTVSGLIVQHLHAPQSRGEKEEAARGVPSDL